MNKVIKNPFERMQKGAVIILCIVLAGTFSSCNKKSDSDIDMSKIDFSNIENLYEQPLPVIQNAVQGEWQLQFSVGGFVYQKIIDIHSSYMYITQDHIVMGNDTYGVTTDSPIQWMKGKPFGGDIDAYMLTYNHSICINEQDGVIYEKVPIFNTLVPCQIKNDTLVIADPCCDGFSYYYTKTSNSLNTNH